MHLLLLNQTEVLNACYRKFAEGRTAWMFGYRLNPISKLPQLHNGVDLAAPIGTALFAPWPAKVKRVWGDNLNGNAILLEHTPPEGIPIVASSYAHLAGYPAEVTLGYELLEGDTFAFLGNTGHSTGPHVHAVFWVRDKNGKLVPTDPLPFLAAVCGFAEIPIHDAGNHPAEGEPT